MTVQLTIPFEALLEAIENLSPEEKAVIASLVQPPSEPPALTADEKLRRLQAVMVTTAPGAQFSMRREDWYGDDGR